MPAAKTAISLSPTLLKKIDRYTKRQHISRSGFFALAAERFLRADEGENITRRINDLLDAHPETPGERRARKMFQRSSARVILKMTKDDKW